MKRALNKYKLVAAAKRGLAGCRFWHIIAIVAFVVGCDSADEPEANAPLRPLTSTEQAIVRADQGFGLELLAAVNELDPDSNVVTAPLSVSMALGMATNGAAGTTLSEMIGVLAKGALTETEINDAYSFLLSALPMVDEEVDVSIANSVWYRDGFDVSQDYLARVRQVFLANAEALNFDSPGAPAVINKWVADNTRGLIPTIIESIPQETVAYLINAVYFKGAWRNPFDPDDTIDATFTNLDGSTTPVRLMNHDGDVAHYQTDLYSAVDLPYGDSLFSMTVLLPNPSSNVNELIQALDTNMLDEIESGLRPARVLLALPRFELEYEARLDNALKAMGMTHAFDESRADFSRISSDRQLFISSVVHKTVVTVTEEGTEAAAATSVEVGVTSLPPSVRVDRPFLFLIRERQTGTLLFTGKVAHI